MSDDEMPATKRDLIEALTRYETRFRGTLGYSPQLSIGGLEHGFREALHEMETKLLAAFEAFTPPQRPQ